MNSNLVKLFKNKESLLLNTVFQFFCALLIILLFTYLVTILKVYLQTQKINDIDKKAVTEGTYQQKLDEKKIINYKKKIDTFSLIVSNHTISSHVFNVVEENTLPKIWFSNFDMLQSTNQIKLSGEAHDIGTLSRQVQIFEEDRDYIKSATILDYQVGPSGKIRFILNLSLDPKIFNY